MTDRVRFVTGTGTGIGKTFVTSLMLRQLRVAGQQPSALKPVLSGFDAAKPMESDSGALLDALGQEFTAAALDHISPWRFAAPLSPDMAAAREGRSVPFGALVDHCRAAAASAAGSLLIEGVGGAMVPLDDRHTVLDWMAALGAPAVLVCGTYLGAISHCLTTVAAIQSRQLRIAAIVLSTSIESPVPAEETAAAIARFTDLDIRIVPRVGQMPNLTDLLD